MVSLGAIPQSDGREMWQVLELYLSLTEKGMAVGFGAISQSDGRRDGGRFGSYIYTSVRLLLPHG